MNTDIIIPKLHPTSGWKRGTMEVKGGAVGETEREEERGEKGSHLVSHIRAGRCSPPKCRHPLPKTCAYVALPGQKSLQM